MTTLKLETFKKAIDLAFPAVDSTGMLAVFKNLYFRKGSITAFNTRHAIKIYIQTGVTGKFPGALMKRLVDSLFGEDVTLEVGDDGALVMQAERTDAKIQGSSENWTFADPKFDAEAPFLTVSDEFLEAIEKCSISISTSPLRPEFQGLIVQVLEKDLRMYSCVIEHLHLSEYVMSKTKHSLTAGSKFQMPEFFAEQLLVMHRAFPNDGIEIYPQKDAILALVGDKAMLYAKVPVSTNQVNLSDMVRKQKPADMKLIEISPSLEAAFDRANILLGGKNDGLMEVAIEGDTAVTKTTALRAEGPPNVVVDEFDVKGHSNNCKFTVIPSLVLPGLKYARQVYFSKARLVMSDGGAWTHFVGTHLG